MISISPEQAAAYFAASNLGLNNHVWIGNRNAEPVTFEDMSYGFIYQTVIETLADADETEAERCWDAEYKHWLKAIKRKKSVHLVKDLARLGFELC